MTLNVSNWRGCTFQHQDQVKFHLDVQDAMIHKVEGLLKIEAEERIRVSGKNNKTVMS